VKKSKALLENFMIARIYARVMERERVVSEFAACLSSLFFARREDSA